MSPNGLKGINSFLLGHIPPERSKGIWAVASCRVPVVTSRGRAWGTEVCLHLHRALAGKTLTVVVVTSRSGPEPPSSQSSAKSRASPGEQRVPRGGWVCGKDQLAGQDGLRGSGREVVGPEGYREGSVLERWLGTGPRAQSWAGVLVRGRSESSQLRRRSSQVPAAPCKSGAGWSTGLGAEPGLEVSNAAAATGVTQPSPSPASSLDRSWLGVRGVGRSHQARTERQERGGPDGTQEAERRRPPASCCCCLGA